MSCLLGEKGHSANRSDATEADSMPIKKTVEFPGFFPPAIGSVYFSDGCNALQSSDIQTPA
jgi:hypothetical protein